MSKGRKLKGRVGSRRLPPLVYGLDGIVEIFNVSKTTAHRYKETFLRDAVSQVGNVIVVDTAEALRLFGVANPERFIVHEDGVVNYKVKTADI